MRLVVHVGMPKAGSTALQTALAAARGPLLARGILYPRGSLNHNFLVAGVAAPGRRGRIYAQQYGDDEARIQADFAAFRDGIAAQVREHRPAVTVLSGELLFGPLGHEGPEAFRAMLAPLGGTLEIACYVRRPSEYYLSMAQQRLKASWEIRPLDPIAYRAPLEAARAAADKVHAVPFERSAFPGGDVVADFAARVLPEADGALAAVEDPKVKASMSAEAMAIVQAFRRVRYPEANNRFTRDTGMLARHLAATEAKMGGQRRPVLRPEVARLVDQSSEDVLWLRDALGIVFDGIDYADIGPREVPRPMSVADICIVDDERRKALAATMREIDLPKGDTERKTFRAAARGARAGEPDDPPPRRGFRFWQAPRK